MFRWSSDSHEIVTVSKQWKDRHKTESYKMLIVMVRFGTEELEANDHPLVVYCVVSQDERSPFYSAPALGYIAI